MHDLSVLVLLVLYFVVGFGLRAYIQYRRTGAYGVQGINAAFGSLEWIAGVLFVIGVVGAFAAPVLDLLGVLRHASCCVTPAVQTIGLLIYLVAAIASFGEQMAMGNSWRVGVPRDEITALVTGGPFAFMRNPIYTTMLASGVGIVLLVPNAAAAISFAALFIGLEIHVRFVEEPHLLQIHGAAYSDYASRVGRFLPFVGRGLSRRLG